MGGLAVARGVVITGCVVSISMALHNKAKCRSDTHTITSLWRQYGANYWMKFTRQKRFKELNHNLNNFMQVQESFLLPWIAKCSKTKYGYDHYFSEVNSIGTFCQSQPLTTYSSYEPYITSLTRGDDLLALTTERPVMLSARGVTSGKNILIPVSDHTLTDLNSTAFIIAFNQMVSQKPQVMEMQRNMRIFSHLHSPKSSSGLKISSISSPENSSSLWYRYSTPEWAFEINTEPEAMYIMLLFALADQNLGFIEADLSSTVCKTMVYLCKNWSKLVEDLELGVINSDVKISFEMRQRLKKKLRRVMHRGRRARFLREEFSKGFQDIVKRIWPHFHFVLCKTSGCQDLYTSQLKATFAGDCDIYSPMYGGAEGLFGINLDILEQKTRYTLMPQTAFYEFIPVEHIDEEQPPTLLASQVKLNEDYELVVTNHSGLFRYRLGDVVRVVDQRGQAPVIELKFRKDQVLNLEGEKVDEESFYKALMNVFGQQRVALVNYCCTESKTAAGMQKGGVPHYVLFVESTSKELSESSIPSQLDQELRTHNCTYDTLRQNGKIGPVDVLIVQPGTFEQLLEHLADSSQVSASYLEIPRVAADPETVEFLMTRVVSEGKGKLE